MEFEQGEKIEILLSRLDFHVAEIQRRQENETRLFEWTTALLLAVFAVLISVSDISAIFANPVLVKWIATVMIGIPTAVFAVRILSENQSMARQGKIVEAIQEELRFFDKGVYIQDQSLYPNRWRHGFAQSMLTRRTPTYYVIVIVVMALCVIATLWLIK
ncbi:MAG: hypothetical protein QNJ45_01870 [Ardenticatenaceae bacterium]|nr:hypothetical protein [Ardenticatenaceae bacterium]